MQASIEHPTYTLAEELAHSITHGIGGLLSIAALVVLVSMAQGAVAVAACGAFGGTLVLTYVASTLYHAFPRSWPRAKATLRKLDHCSIFLLIAGTYTPMILLASGSGRGIGLLATVWGLAVCGVIHELWHPKGQRVVSILLYLVMGWLVVAAGRPMLTGMAADTLTLLSLGGVIYTLGVGFYVWRSLPYAHAIWHGFVLAGSTLHFWCVLTLINR